MICTYSCGFFSMHSIVRRQVMHSSGIWPFEDRSLRKPK
jgi:hypothetical protein